MSLTIISCPRFADHLMPPGHPERSARAEVMRAIAAKWAALGVPVLEPRPAVREELARVHTREYLDLIAGIAGGATMLDEDTFTSPDTPDVAALAAGAAIVAVDDVLESHLRPLGPSPFDAAQGAPSQRRGADLRTIAPTGETPVPQGEVRASLALVRPPGHHAKAGRAMGFCIYNNVAIAAAHARARGVARVAIVDVDVHHGNGTQWSFYDDPNVLVMSTHQFPLYPGSGAADETGGGDGTGYTVNVPLEAGATDGDYHLVFEQIVLPVLHAFAPDLVLVAAGFDAHMRDPLAQMAMSSAGYTTLFRMLRGLAAERRCPLALVTEGGYHLQALTACLDGLVALLADVPSTQHAAPAPGTTHQAPGTTEPLSPDEVPLVEQETAEPTHRGPAAVDLVRAVQKPCWPTL